MMTKIRKTIHLKETHMSIFNENFINFIDFYTSLSSQMFIFYLYVSVILKCFYFLMKTF